MINTKKIKIINKELVQFYSLFFLTIFFVYYSPVIINRLYFILLLAFFWNSKKDYFWFVFVFVLISEPALLFHGSLRTDVHRIPLYPIFSRGFSFGFYDLFFILAFIKALLKGKKTKLILKKPLIYLLFYLIFLILLSFVHGTNINIIIPSFRNFTVFTLFFSFPFLVHKKEDFFKLKHLVFPIVFLIIFSQFFQLFTDSSLYSLVTGQDISIIQLQESTGYSDFIRPASRGPMLVFFSFIFTLFLIEKKDYLGKKSYLYLILMLSVLSIFISATRSWIVMFAVILLLYLFFIAKKNAKLLFQVSLVTLILLFSYLLIPRLEYSVDNSWRRLSTIEDLLAGDLTADGSYIRIHIRLPRVLKGIEQNPIFGWGFSETYRIYGDPHVGTFNLLLHAGITGLILFVILWINYLKMIFFTRKRLSKKNVLKNPLLVLVVSFLGILVLQLTQFVFFAYDLGRDRAYFIIIFLCFSEFFVKEALKKEMSKKHPGSH